MQLTGRRAVAFQNSKTPRHWSQAQPAVGCSDLATLLSHTFASHLPQLHRREVWQQPNRKATRSQQQNYRRVSRNNLKLCQHEPPDLKCYHAEHTTPPSGGESEARTATATTMVDSRRTENLPTSRSQTARRTGDFVVHGACAVAEPEAVYPPCRPSSSDENCL